MMMCSDAEYDPSETAAATKDSDEWKDLMDWLQWRLENDGFVTWGPGFLEGTDWPTRTEDLRQFTTLHKWLRITLYCDRPEDKALWVEYYEHGLMDAQDAEITYPEFDPARLE